MQKTRMAVLAAAFGAVAFSASAVSTVSVTGNFPGAIDGQNDFITELTAAGSPTFGDSASFFLNMRSILTFTLVAAESGRQNDFTVQGLGTLSEPAGNVGAGRLGEGADFMTANFGSLSGTFDAGSLDALLQFSNADDGDILPGEVMFGVFTPNGPGDYSKFFLALDDGDEVDDNHDDMIIRVDVSQIPLPASVLMLLAALGGLGVVSRRRSA